MPTKTCLTLRGEPESADRSGASAVRDPFSILLGGFVGLSAEAVEELG